MVKTKKVIPLNKEWQGYRKYNMRKSADNK